MRQEKHIVSFELLNFLMPYILQYGKVVKMTEFLDDSTKEETWVEAAGIDDVTAEESGGTGGVDEIGLREIKFGKWEQIEGN